MATVEYLQGMGYTYTEPEKARGHVWKVDEDGEIDIWAYASGEYHNGPECANCGYGFCHHCEDGPDCDCSAVGKS